MKGIGVAALSSGRALLLLRLRASLPRLTYLRLTSPDDSETIVSIFANSPHLRSLDLSGIHSSTLLAQDHLRHLKHPEKIETLLLCGSGSLAETASTFGNLTSLKRLTLVGRFEVEDAAFCVALGRTPLEHLTLRIYGYSPSLLQSGGSFASTFPIPLSGTSPSTDTLSLEPLPFITAAVQPPNWLNRLTLDMPGVFKKGPSAEDVDHDPWEFDPRSQPVFTKFLGRSRGEELMSLGKRKRIQVDGTAVEAVEIDRFADDERAKIKAFLRETGDERGDGWLSETDDEYEP